MRGNSRFKFSAYFSRYTGSCSTRIDVVEDVVLGDGAILPLTRLATQATLSPPGRGGGEAGAWLPLLPGGEKVARTGRMRGLCCSHTPSEFLQRPVGDVVDALAGVGVAVAREALESAGARNKCRSAGTSVASGLNGCPDAGVSETMIEFGFRPRLKNRGILIGISIKIAVKVDELS